MSQQIFLILFLFSSLILVHEFGHFISARLLGVKVERFALGFGPTVFSKTFGETEYALCCVFIGGYVKMLGESPGSEVPEEERSRSYSALSPGKRSIIVVMGVIFNILFSIAILSVVFLTGIKAVSPVVGDVQPNSPAAVAGILPGDRILEVNGKAINRWEQSTKIIQRRLGQATALRLNRNGTAISVSVTPEQRTITDILRDKLIVGAIGIAPKGDTFIHSEPPLNAVGAAITKAWDMITLVARALVKLARGQLPLTDLGGPIMIIKTIKDQATGFTNYLIALAFLNVNIGVVNLLPIPAFDGGQLLFLGIEAVRKKPLNPKTMLFMQRVGISMIIILFVFVMYNDLQKLALN